MVTDQDFVGEFLLKRGYTKMCIGIHTGSEPLKHLNFATLITPDIFDWIGREAYIYKKERNEGLW